MALTPDAIRTLGEIMLDEKTPATRVMAADKILDRALGRAPQFASADFHNQANQKDAVKRSRLANRSVLLRCSPDGNGLKTLSRLGKDVVARMAQEVIRGANVIDCNFWRRNSTKL